MIVVADSNPLIGLAKGGVFPLLRSLFGTLSVPQAVWDEVAVRGAGLPGSAELSEAKGHWIEVIDPPLSARPIILTVSDLEDRAVLALAEHLGADWLITDDRNVRRVAQTIGISLLYTVDVVRLGKLAGFVASCQVVLDQMIANGFGVRPGLYQDVLQRVGEL